MKTISLVTLLLSTTLFFITNNQMFKCIGLFGMVLAISIFVDYIFSIKKIKKPY